ncbi:MAG: glycosyltransferase family 52 [Pseudomonadota bacterium]
MDLFICSTALQTKIAQRIIEECKITDYELFYFTHVENNKEKYYFEKLAEKSKGSTFYICRTRFPSYFSNIKRLFEKKFYDDIYLGSVDNVYAHLVLSYCRFSNLMTFDDGASNISKSSMYYVSRRSIFAEYIYFLFGCRYSLEKVKRKSLEHFSIYPSAENIIENVKHISLFDDCVLSRDRYLLQGECHVFLGCLWSVVSKERVSSLVSDLEMYFEKLDNCFYIPHPKDNTTYFDSLERLPGDLIAEDLIIELSKKFKTVNVYGIGSAALFNLLGIQWVNVFTLIHSDLAEIFAQLSYSLIGNGAKSFHVE